VAQTSGLLVQISRYLDWVTDLLPHNSIKPSQEHQSRLAQPGFISHYKDVIKEPVYKRF